MCASSFDKEFQGICDFSTMILLEELALIETLFLLVTVEFALLEKTLSETIPQMNQERVSMFVITATINVPEK